MYFHGYRGIANNPPLRSEIGQISPNVRGAFIAYQKLSENVRGFLLLFRISRPFKVTTSTIRTALFSEIHINSKKNRMKQLTSQIDQKLAKDLRKNNEKS